MGYGMSAAAAAATPTALRATNSRRDGTADTPALLTGGAWFYALAPRLSTCRSEEHTSELQSHSDLVCRLLLEKKKTNTTSKSSKHKSPQLSGWRQIISLIT